MTEILIEYARRAAGKLAIQEAVSHVPSDLDLLQVGKNGLSRFVWVEPDKITVAYKQWLYDLHDPNFVPEDLCKEILEFLLG